MCLREAQWHQLIVTFTSRWNPLGDCVLPKWHQFLGRNKVSWLLESIPSLPSRVAQTSLLAKCGNVRASSQGGAGDVGAQLRACSTASPWWMAVVTKPQAVPVLWRAHSPTPSICLETLTCPSPSNPLNSGSGCIWEATPALLRPPPSPHLTPSPLAVALWRVTAHCVVTSGCYPRGQRPHPFALSVSTSTSITTAE